MLCLHCLEARLGRPLDDSDFVSTPLQILERMLPPETQDGKPYAQWLDDQWEADCQLRLPGLE